MFDKFGPIALLLVTAATSTCAFVPSALTSPLHTIHSVTNQIRRHPPRTQIHMSSETPLKSAGMTADEREKAIEKATKAMTKFSNRYLANTSTKLCSNKSIPAVVIKGLAEHKVDLGAPLCPCRFYENKQEEANDGFWNCPCVPMRERHECHCMLFLKDDHAFAGDETEITVDEVVKFSNNMK